MRDYDLRRDNQQHNKEATGTTKYRIIGTLKAKDLFEEKASLYVRIDYNSRGQHPPQNLSVLSTPHHLYVRIGYNFAPIYMNSILH